MSMPILQTSRLTLRPFNTADAPRVELLAGNRVVSSMTARIPHPYPNGLAARWIASHQQAYRECRLLALAIELKECQTLIGAVSLSDISSFHRRAELGYWLGTDFWQQGYCCEAVMVMINHAFTSLELNRVDGHCLSKNKASANVMINCGMQFEGERRQHLNIKGHLEDISYFGILASDWQQA
ncbi:GNAT family N-acetyltransferase [Edaphovirga cremea]|jgi:ribosomal-protein-alanine N-acetyltransferase|uniref:GNAT family N-acetyltransferase n=1 Tax=Edaphovirga cremea TaxID=2267246 RepID=UPI000DF0142F|nr:GNAT family N-acetyltransferase [Edaphovirga cremea]